MQVHSSGLVTHPTPAPLPAGFDTITSALERAADEHPDGIALIDGDRSWTFAELRTAVSEAATSIDLDQPFLVSGENSAELVIELFGALTSGAAVFFNPPSSVDCTHMLGLLNSAPDSARCVGFTSGSSGTPKAVTHSERNLLLPALISADVEPPSDGERIGTSLSLAIINVMVLGPISALVRRSTFVVLPQTSPSTTGLIDGVASHSVTRLFTVATQLHDLVTHVDDLSPLNSLNRVIVGGSGANPDTIEMFAQRFGVRPTLSYGMTEAPTGVVRESFDDPIGSGRGFALPHIDVSIRTADGQVASPGDEGEVCLTSSSTGPWANTWTGTHGYLGDPDRSADLFADGVLHTGDRGYLDEDGAVHVTGRHTSLIIRGGMNVDPQAVTDALLSHPAVAQAAVCGFDDDRLGQKIGAVVVAADGQSVDQDDLRALVQERLSPHAAPDQIFEWLELPRSPLGKPTALDPAVFVKRKGV